MRKAKTGTQDMHFLVGHASDTTRGTGCSVLLFPEGATASCDVRGGAPGTRETDLLEPHCLVPKINALLFCGGSARGLAAADGVMSWCAAKKWGFDTGFGAVPIVPAACLFDLNVGEAGGYPDAIMGEEACRNASFPMNSPMGNVGAGTGATVGKYAGPEKAMKSGLGWSVSKKGDLCVYALVAVNAYGAVKDAEGKFMAGAVGSTVAVQSPTDVLLGESHWAEWGRNTTLVAVVTNAGMDKADCRRVAFMAASGMAESIFPVHTPFDGDTVFCVSTGQMKGECLEVGMLAAMAVSEAVRRGVRHAESAWGFPGLGDGNQ